ncbi:ABC transporter permease [Pleomorphomonas oryzae]|uniref:ABC transporter permease n=1 Tax=Pleomorphomonas oryzae TaxID=261934 RepID=UPI00041ADEE2|nr:ABC transporter permease [Pleomorphomonas oryzae]
MTDTTLINPTPVDTNDAKEALYRATPRQLMWWRFRKHKLAVISLCVLVFAYLTIAFAEFTAPYDPYEITEMATMQPPQPVHLFDEDWNFQGPFVYGLKRTRDLETAAVIYTVDTDEIVPLRFFVEGPEYLFWGLIPGSIHLFGAEDPDARIYLLGTDTLGRDLLSRLIHGGRTTLTIGILGVFFSFLIGITLGSISGYYGGRTDGAIQRLMEFIRSIPTIPLWMGLAAALPVEWDPLFVYFLITILLSLISWTHLARTVRGSFLSLRGEDYVLAARLLGASEKRIIIKHMLPAMTSYIIAAVTLSVPEMILGETALSFLGLGLRPPVVSWGVLLQEAQSLRVIVQAPWLLLPGLAIVIIVLSFNFLGDGLRDAADPYGR